MLRLAARYANAWNTAWFGLPDQQLRRRLATMQAAGHHAHGAEGRRPRPGDAAPRRGYGRPPPDLTGSDRAAGRSFGGLVDELARAIDAYERLGIDDLIVSLNPRTEAALDRLARAIEIRSH
jgi:alkanesulfonate monooxygenase SsuD/methylene tetrahydromethanopterin reductase-like flavin-dependent oxidoreductase (luciferase family)